MPRPDQLPSMKIESDNLRWAITHLIKYGDTDIFPEMPELNAIKFAKEKYISSLAAIDLKNYRFCVPRRTAIPKTYGGYRVASQLDADDTIMYSALVYGISKQAERSRIPKRRKISCSYRVKTTSDGGFFHDNNGYDDFKETTVKFLANKSVKYVLCVDISDFYNQLSHHRIRNNLDSASCEKDASLHIENCLSALCSNQHSRGIPVGPTASIVLAESALIDFDDWMIRQGVKYCRYVDDFRIFFNKQIEAISFLSDFTNELYHSHRLSPNSTKTKIYEKEQFLGSEWLDEEELEETKRIERLWEIVSEMNAYEPDEQDEKKAIMKAIKDLFDIVKSDEPLPLGLARFVLRRARLTRTRGIMPGLLDNLDKFVPVLRDVAFYVLTMDKKGDKGYVKSLITHFSSTSNYRNVDFVKEWVLHLCIRCPGVFRQYSQHEKIINWCGASLGELYEPLLAAANNKWEVIRSYKERIDGVSRRARRSIVLSSCVLSEDEKKHWLTQFENETGDYAMRCCAAWAKANNVIQWTR